MKDYDLINLKDILKINGELKTSKLLEKFKCSKNTDIENFLKRSAIDFENKKISSTHIVMDKDDNFLGFITLAHKPLSIMTDSVSKNSLNKISRFSKKIDKNTHLLSAFLVAQLARNDSFGSNHLSGDDLIEIALMVFKQVQYQIGGGVVYLECLDNKKLLDFYQKECNGFKLFGERKSDNDCIYKQLYKLI